MRLRALLAAAVLTVSTAPAAWAVAHGSDVPPGQYGFVAKLAMTKIPRPDGSTYSSYCTGALVAPAWVLTTGHCFHDAHRDRVSGKVPYPTTVTLGLTDEATESGVARKATEVLQAKENDVALVRLDSPVTAVTPRVSRYRSDPATDGPASTTDQSSTARATSSSCTSSSTRLTRASIFPPVTERGSCYYCASDFCEAAEESLCPTDTARPPRG